MLSSRLINRVAEDLEEFLEIKLLYSAFHLDMKEKGEYYNDNPRLFSQHIVAVFPSAVRKKNVQILLINIKDCPIRELKHLQKNHVLK